MNKLWLIIKREYLSRVTNKMFLVATLLTPLAFGAIMFLSGYLMKDSMNSERKILVKDNSGILKTTDFNSKSMTYDFSTKSVENLKSSYGENGYDMLVVVPEITDLSQQKVKATFYAKDKQSLNTLERLEKQISKSIKRHKLENSGIPSDKLAALEVDTVLENGSSLDGDNTSGDTSSRTAIAISTGLSYFMGFLMYMVIFIYGMMVMRSVMEEKINRIVEVMISTVKPIHLMLGKIIGVGLVGLTQLAIWLILIPLILVGVNMIFGTSEMPQMAQTQEAMEKINEMNAKTDGNFIVEMISELSNMNWALIIPVFIIFFLGGYFIYSSLFAAVGSAMGDDIGEGQQLTIPITLPVIISFIMIPSVFNDPDGPIAIFGSMFPLFSPILMPARLPFDPPLWQVAISIVILIASIVFFAWLAGKIYRTGILMYGKKTSFKEIAKWIRY